MSEAVEIIDLTPETIANYGVCGYKDVSKHKELRNKIEWFKTYHKAGLKIKALISDKGTYQGMLEYLPGELAHRPVNAHGYLFIHCIFVGFNKAFKGRGYASALIEECINDAKDQNKAGVAVVTRKGSFMTDKQVFLKRGFEHIDSAHPDFELLAFKFDHASPNPSFKTLTSSNLAKYKHGLTIMRSPQCPYTEKNVNAIIDTAEKKYKLRTQLIDLSDAKAAQATPCAFGTFCIICNGEVISHHPISNKRFENIMDKMLT